jgi:hypothetical protein
MTTGAAHFPSYLCRFYMAEGGFDIITIEAPDHQRRRSLRTAAP